jgi:histidinol dehydrogenase
VVLRIFDYHSAGCRRFLQQLSDRRGSDTPQVEAAVTQIVAAVRDKGDAALLRLTKELDGVTMTRDRLRVTSEELLAAKASLPSKERAALTTAAKRISAFHRRTLEKSFSYRDELGMRLGQIVRPLRRVGIYVPGGQGAYPSSVLMNALPARVAGVKEIAMASPPGKTGDNPGVFAAAAIAGVNEVYRVGGAQAVAALAFGTATIKPVDKIVGPGNAYVQAAKRMVYGATDIDKIAGPSEVLIIADEKARPNWIAADLIAQSEHGSGDEAAVLLTPVREVAEATRMALERALSDLPRAAAVRRVMAQRGAAIVVDSLEQAFELANQIGPEHLELDVTDASSWLNHVEAAGAVFLGAQSPAPLGDYIAGPNHVLPTAGAARYASPLGAYDFLKRTSIIAASARALHVLGPATAQLARLEGFEGHARAVEARLRSNND